jgi:hypothetical protein
MPTRPMATSVAMWAKPVRPAALGAGKAEVVIDDADGGARPAELQRFIDESVLATRRFGIVVDLRQGRLADVDEGGPAQMIGADGVDISHDWTPCLLTARPARSRETRRRL